MLLTLLYAILLTCHSLPLPQEPVSRWLVELKTASTVCLDQWWVDQGLDRTSNLKKTLPVDDWMVVEVPDRYTASLMVLSCVRRILPDHRIEWRNTVPNDPVYINQGDMNLIGMPKAWDISTGGLTTRGDTIVVAVVDDGFDINHPDLIPNIWLNRAEIPNDNIDNDDNGYTDDYRGLNIITGHDNHQLENHGTEVSGVIGAKGNNAMGIAGVSWNVKLMLLSGADFESEVIEGYQYILDMRKKYNDSHGNEGAFVVATNLSGGINGALAIDHPLWCGMYDKLGEAGILSVTAAPNQSVSVDVDGDMPTTCTSPFMIAVTNVDPTDVIMGNAGFGETSIDIGAPGEGTITTFPNGQYKVFSGTSAAAPHVSGTIGLLYSTTCASFLEDIESDPDGIALKIRDIIFSTATSNNSLEGITVTGKRLQADASLMESVADCGVVMNPGVRIRYISPNPASSEFANIFFEVRGDTSTAYFDLYTTGGAKVSTYPISQAEFQQGFISLDTEPLPAAIYFITLRNKKDKATSRLFVY